MQNISKDDIKQKIQALEEGNPATDSENSAFYESKAIQQKIYEETINDMIHFRKLRENYASRCFWFMVSWSIAVLLILLACGFPSFPFALPDSVLIVFVGSTTINVIGLVFAIVKGLFSNK
jgi:hypothetical protein